MIGIMLSQAFCALVALICLADVVMGRTDFPPAFQAAWATSIVGFLVFERELARAKRAMRDREESEL